VLLSHFIAFNDISSKYFSNVLKASSLYIISCIRQPVAQGLDKIHILYARTFCRPTSGVINLSKVATRLRLNVLVYMSRCCVNIEKRYLKGGHDTFLLNCNIVFKRPTADLAFVPSRFSQALLQESFMVISIQSTSLQMVTSIQSRSLERY